MQHIGTVDVLESPQNLVEEVADMVVTQRLTLGMVSYLKHNDSIVIENKQFHYYVHSVTDHSIYILYIMACIRGNLLSRYILVAFHK